MRAAWKVPTAEEGEKRLEQLARFLEHDYESAAGSLREGMAEMFTLQKLQIPGSLHKCLATTNIIESPQGGVQRRTDNVTRWRDQDMVQRWVASAGLLTEQHFRKILGYQDLWALAAILGRDTKTSPDQIRSLGIYFPPCPTRNAEVATPRIGPGLSFAYAGFSQSYICVRG